MIHSDSEKEVIMAEKSETIEVQANDGGDDALKNQEEGSGELKEDQEGGVE